MRTFWHLYGVARSAFMYRLKPASYHRRAKTFYAQFLQPGELAFDIGAHFGDRVAAFRAIGARVVAVEPQPAFQKVLGLLHGRDSGVTLVKAAVGAEPGSATMLVSVRTPTMSTLAQGWTRTLHQSSRFSDVRWDERIEVPGTTLDQLIATHGEPAFCKIDVEGFEAEVLAGLSRPLRGLSFEVIPAAPAVTTACLDRTESLGRYAFNLSMGESKDLEWPDWRPRSAVDAWLAAQASDAPSGDIYAKLMG